MDYLGSTSDSLITPPREFFTAGAVEVAQQLLGTYLLAHSDRSGEEVVGGRIVETEAYTRNDPASHSYPGPTQRNKSMFGTAGLLYVYRIYGVHFCLNVVAGATGVGEAVLLRAIEPIWGVKRMARQRGMKFDEDSNTLGQRGRSLKGIADGPGKLAQALGVTFDYDGTDLIDGKVLILLPRRPMKRARIVATRRIGIRKGAEKLWRFVDSESELLSRPLLRSSWGGV